MAEKSQSSTDKKKVEKYLTEIKELPPEAQGEVLKEKPKEKTELPEVVPPAPPEKVTSLDENLVLDKDKEDEEENFLGKLPLSPKDLILGAVNLVTLVLLIIILLRFPDRADELRALRVEDLRNRSNVTHEFTQIENNKGKSQELEGLFVNESGVVEFVGDVEAIRAEGGSYRGISFASQQAVEDKSGNLGLPIVIELAGSWAAIDSDLQKIDQLPYLFRPVLVDIEPSETEEGVIVFKYGIFLYVNDEFSQTR